MPTILTHAVIAGVAARTGADREERRSVLAAAIVVSVLPDADVLGFFLGVPYEHSFGHRGFFHSLFFALVLSVGVVITGFRRCRFPSRKWWSAVAFLFLVGASHGVLDALTNGGLGIALLAPFDNTRYFFPWTPIPVSPIGLRAFLSPWGLRVLLGEIALVWLPAFAIAMAYVDLKRRLTAARPGSDLA